MSKIRQAARGRECQIRLVGICNFNPETTVGCHFRMAGLCGMGLKPSDLHIAFGCSDCHRYVDTHKDAETQLAFAHGVLRTQYMLLNEGVIKT
jgi:hypothetical protein